MNKGKSRSASECKAMKEIRRFLVVVLLFIVVIALGVSVYMKLNPKDTLVNNTDNDANRDGIPDKIVTESGFVLEGNNAKTVKQFRTLAEAETDMGYYLGLHNTIQCDSNYTLIGMYKINDGEWYQALFEDIRATEEIEKKLANGEEITTEYLDTIGDKYPGLTIKTSNTGSIDKLVDPYNDFDNSQVINIGGVDITFESESDSQVNLAYFSVKNGKLYSIYTTYGIKSEIMVNILDELINNLKMMEDWVE